MKAETAKPSKGSKPKSPPAPSRELKDCFEDVKKLYTQYSHATFSKAEIASTIGLSASSGPFASRLFTLKEYGLIDSAGTEYKVSQRFLAMNSNPVGSPVFKQQALGAIRGSAVFKEILDEFKNKLPSQAGVAQRLETQKKFNAEKAKHTAAVLENSLRFAGVLDSNNNIIPIRETPVEDATSTTDSTTPVEDERRPHDLKIEVALGGSRKATVLYPPDITKEEAQKIGKVLEAVVG